MAAISKYFKEKSLFIRTLFLSLLLVFLILPIESQSAGQSLTVSFIDVDHGDSILVEFPNSEVMLIDAGSSDKGYKVYKYLKSRKIKSIDILVASHPHEDHIGGMPYLLNKFPIGEIWDSGYEHGSKKQMQFLGIIEKKNIPFITPRAGFKKEIGEVQIEVLSPSEPLITKTSSDANNNSIVLYLSFGKIGFLLMADLQNEGRARIKKWPDCTVLKVAHHGSKDGIDKIFLHAVSPEIAVISYGKDNGYGHPHPDTLKLLEDSGCILKSTALNGTIIISTDGETWSLKTMDANMD